MPDNSNPYYGAFTGKKIDSLLSKVDSNSELWDNKQEKITGTPGQTLTIDSFGNVVATTPTPKEITAEMVEFDNSGTDLSETDLQGAVVELSQKSTAISNIATSANTKADTAQSTANSAQTAANTAQSTANQAVTAANNAQESADEALEAIDNATTVLENAVSDISTINQNIGQITSLTTDDKADLVSAINEINGKIPNGFVYNGFLLWLARDGEKVGEPVRIYNGADFEEVAIPIQQGTLTYNGDEQSPTWAGYNSEQMVMSGTMSAVDSGTYYVTFSLLAGCCWPDGGTAALNIPWEIKRQPIYATPSQNGSLTYTGVSQTPTWDNYDSEKLIIGGTVSATNAGEWAATFTPKSNYCWPDESITAKTINWIIGRQATAEVPSQSGTLTYTGEVLVAVFGNYNSAKVAIGGTTSGTNAGNYNATATPTENYCWPDGSADAVIVVWTIGRQTISTIPSQSGTLTYTGESLSPTFTNYNSDEMILGGTTSAIDAGEYEATITPDGNHCWSDGGVDAKVVSWSIGKAAGSLSIIPTSLSLGTNNPSDTITVTRSGDGEITAISSDTSIATVSVEGNTVTVTSAGSGGDATITVSVAEGTNYFALGSKICTVAVNLSVGYYGAEWDGTSTTRWTRTDDAADFVDPVPYVNGATSYGSPFDNIMPWAGMVVSERTGGTMVAIPKFWYKLTQEGSGLKIQIADKATDGFSVSPAHMNRGDGKGERDIVYVGRYHCGSDYKSTTGVKPKASVTRSAARTAIHKLGSDIWQMDFATRFTIWLLYIVEFANWNSQQTIGYGCGNNSSTQVMGYTDSMPYHTGTALSAQSSYGLGTQYRNIEGLWDNVADWFDGCYITSSGLYLILNPNNYKDSGGGTFIGAFINGWPSSFAVSSTAGFPMFYASKTGGSQTTYSCDWWGCSTSSNQCLFGGGTFYRSTQDGMFHISGTTTTFAGSSVGARISELP